MKKLTLALLSTLAAVALVTGGCGADTATNSKAAAPAKAASTCPATWRPGWQQLANRIHAPVYCPAWVPDPLTGQIVGQVSFGGAGGPAVSVSPDRSYLVSLAWAEPQSGEVHVNLRGYPGRIKVPTCIYEDYNHGKIYRKPVPCFSDARGTAHERGITATVYTVNQDADLWHVLYAWHYRGGLYTLSEHVAVPLTYAKVVANLHHMLRDLVLVDPRADVRLTRKQLLAGAGAGALGAAGIYELVDRLTPAPKRAAAPARPLPLEQHVLDGVRIVRDNGVEVLVPPLHHQLVTLELRAGESAHDLQQAQAALEHALASLEGRYAPTPAGLGATVGWGLPYFHRYVPKLATRYLPVDNRASKAKGRPTRALLDAIRFPSDPPQTILEQNDAALLLRSDSLDAIKQASHELVDNLDFWRPTSIRRGFAGGGFDGGQSLPKRMAMAAGVGGADLIPEHAELFLGFTSTQKAGLGPARIANLETLGYSDGGPGGYFRRGTAMHVSHIFEDLEGWYINFDHAQRVSTTFRPTVSVPSGTLTVRQGPGDVATERQNERDYRRYRAIGHSASIQTSSRLAADVTGMDGTLYRKGTAIPHRADFNTLDNPFFWSARPDVDGMSSQPAAGLHFVVFNPTSDDFHRNRLAMDGVLPDGTKLPFDPKDRGQGFNSVLTTTHRQNFLVPPRRHRAFPLAELLA